MKALTDKKWRNTANAWGQFTDSAEQVFEIEPSDVGLTRKDYRGQAHSSYTFTRSDTGKRITVYTDASAWTCWVFGGETN